MFSVIMPVRNRSDLAPRAIKSVLEQTFKDYELLVIDDGSEDNLEGMVRPYLSEKVIYHHNPHGGVGAARNFGLSKARFPFIAYLDSDNLWHPEFLSNMYNAIHSDDTPSEAAYCMADRYEQSAATGKFSRTGTMGEQFNFRKLLAGNYIDINMFVHSQKAFKYAGIFDESLKRLSDWDFIIRVTSLFEPIFVPKVFVTCYLNVADNALSLTKTSELAERIVRKKHTGFKEPITVVHDTIEYTWTDLPEKKYRNWVRIHHEQLNTSDYTAWGYPFILQIEPTNICNLECPLCPAGQRKLGRKLRHMKLEEFKSIIDDMESYLLLLVLWNWGEPFMNPSLPEIIRYAAERDIRTVTSTNAHFLNDDAYVEAMLKSGLSTLFVAIDSTCNDSYQAYRKRGSLNKVLSGLQNLVAIKKRIGSETLINMRMVIMKQNEHELSKLRRLARKFGADWFGVKTVHISYDETIPDSEIVAVNPKYRYYAYKPNTYERIRVSATCRKVWEMAGIFSNGDVIPCCYDYNNTRKVANVFEQPLTEIWNGPAFQELRKQVHNQMQSLPLCRQCELNFKLSKAGWFTESHPTGFIKHLRRDLRRLKTNTNELLYRLPDKKVVKAIWKRSH